MGKTIVIGLGNPILSDDGVGVLVAAELERKLGDRDDIRIEEASVGGLRLAEMLEGFERAIIVDAMFGSEYRSPGTIHVMTPEDLDRASTTQHTASAHDTSLSTALECGRRIGLHLPRDITIVGIEVENVIDFGEILSPAVAAIIPRAVETIWRKLDREDATLNPVD